MFGAQFCKLILSVHVVDGDLALLHKVLDEKIPRPLRVCMIAGDVQC